MKRQNYSLTEGSIVKGIMLFAFPIFLSNVFQQLYNAADAFIVGNFLGSTALAAVGSSGSLIFLLIGFFSGLSMGAGVIIARYFGARDIKNLRKSIETTFIIGIIAGLILMILGVVFTPKILVLMGTPENVILESIKYFRMYFMGVIAVVMFNIVSSILQSVGDSRTPMIFLILASLTNVILDYIFIGLFHKGVEWAAFATVLSNAMAFLLSLQKLIKTNDIYRLNLKKMSPDRKLLKDILKQGIPSGIQFSVISIANVIVQANINSFGSDAMAGCGAYAKVEGFAFLPVTCFSLALATFISQNIGAEKPERVKRGIKFSIFTSLLIAETIGIITYVFAPQLIAIFTDSKEVMLYGIKNAKVMSLFYFLLAYAHCVAGIMRGIEKPMVPMVIMLSIWCVLRVAYITVTLKYINKIEVVFWAYPLTWGVSSLLFTYYLVKDVLRKF